MIRKFARKILVLLCCFLMGALSIVSWSVYNNKKAEQGAKTEAGTQTKIVKDNEEPKEEINNKELKEDVNEEKKEEVKEEKSVDKKEEKKEEEKTETPATVAIPEQGGQTLIPGLQQSLQQISQGLENHSQSYDKLVQKLLPSVVHI